jgi:putative oxidoreductase
MPSFFQRILQVYGRALDRLQPFFLLGVRLYWGAQFVQTGWGKLHHLAGVTQYFASLGIPLPHVTAIAVGALEFTGGALLIGGLGSRVIALALTGNMLAAFWFGDHQALLSVFSEPDKFYAAAPYTFLFASLLVLVFGPGRMALDALVARLAPGRITVATA